MANGSNLALAGFSPLVKELPLAKTVIYTVPANRNTLIASIEVFNPTPGSVDVTLYINVGTGDFAFGIPTITTMASHVDTASRNLPSGTTISALSNTAGVNCVIQLREYTP